LVGGGWHGPECPDPSPRRHPPQPRRRRRDCRIPATSYILKPRRHDRHRSSWLRFTDCFLQRDADRHRALSRASGQNTATTGEGVPCQGILRHADIHGGPCAASADGRARAHRLRPWAGTWTDAAETTVRRKRRTLRNAPQPRAPRSSVAMAATSPAKLLPMVRPSLRTEPSRQQRRAGGQTNNRQRRPLPGPRTFRNRSVRCARVVGAEQRACFLHSRRAERVPASNRRPAREGIVAAAAKRP